MNAPALIARRYLSSAKSNRFLSWMTILSISGIGIGIAAMIDVLAVINGFERELRDRFLAANAHVLAFQYPNGVDDIDSWIKLVSKDFQKEISGVSPFIHSETMATKDGLMHNILIRGIHPQMRQKVQDLTRWVSPVTALDELQKSFDNSAYQNEPRPIILGSGLLSILQAKVGETVKLVSPESSSMGELIDFKVVGIYDSGLKHYDNKIGITGLYDAQNFFKMGKRVHGLEIGLVDGSRSATIAEKMKEKYTLTIKEWQSFNKQMFESLEMERAVIALIVALVAFVGGFNILTTLFIVVTQKQRSISILKALGATNWQIQKIFIFQGFFIGLLGAAMGSVLAVLICKFLETFEVVNLPDLYLLAKLPITYDVRVYLMSAGVGCLICVLAGIYPAWVASKINIVDGFRGNNG